MGRGKGKGSQFERDICRLFSEWWSKRGDDDLFWRTQSSGARATQRKKRGQRTRGQYGDVCAVDSRGQTLIKTAIISLKRGYAKVSISDIIDRVSYEKRSELVEWIRECIEHKIDAKSLGWLLVVRRDRRRAIVIMPLTLMWRIKAIAPKLGKIKPQAIVLASLRDPHGYTTNLKPKKLKKLGHKKLMKRQLRTECAIFACPLEDFMERVDRSDIVKVFRKWKKEAK